jgi:phosphoglycerate dehydrogenase-like enzyme
MTLLLAVAKHLKFIERSLEQAEKADYFTDYDGLEVHGLTLGLIGLGQIGGRVARVAQALGMRVMAVDPYVDPDCARDMGVELARSLESVLRDADIISLHAPLTDETHHMINARTLGLCKRGAILVNTARGALVDETALIAALDSGQLRGAGLDVFESEPPAPDHLLLHRDNVVATPHIAGATGASKDRLWTMAIHQALQVLRDERPPHLANPHVWITARAQKSGSSE